VTVKTPSQINMNTASTCAMQALGLSDAEIGTIVQARRLVPYTPATLGQFSGRGLSLATTTRTFRIEAQGIVGGRVDARLTAIVQKRTDATPPSVQILEWSTTR
jgi:hypothetical protein